MRKAGFFKHAHRAMVPRENLSIQSADVWVVVENVLTETPNAFGCNASPPKWFTEPITDLGRTRRRGVFKNKTDSANALPGDVYRESRLRRGAQGMTQPASGIAERVGGGKDVVKVSRHLAIVGVLLEGFRVRPFPGPNGAVFKLDANGFEPFILSEKLSIAWSN